MALTYDGSHSIAFVRYDSSTSYQVEVKRSWEDWHLIPAGRPTVSPPTPSVSLTKYPGWNQAYDATTVPSGSIDYGLRTGEWEFYVDHDQWDNWSESYREICNFLNGRRVFCVLYDEYDTAYVGRLSVSQWKNGDSYSSIVISYVLDPGSLLNEFDIDPIERFYISFNPGDHVFRQYCSVDEFRPYISLLKVYEGGRVVEINDYEINGSTYYQGDRLFDVIYTSRYYEPVYHFNLTVYISEPGWEVDDTNVLDIYPIGSIYITMNSLNPQDWFGGLWEKFGEGRVIIGSGEGTDANEESQSFTAGDTGGEYEHTLITDEMPSHTHGSKTLTGTTPLNLFTGGQASSSTDGIVTQTKSSNRQYSTKDTSTNSWQKLTVDATHEHDSVGSDDAHNNVQPYIVCNMWKRIG